MKIENNSTRKKVRYDSLKCGDIFEFVEDVFMKTFLDSESGINSVNLITNDLDAMNNYDMVTKLEAKLVIE